MTVHFELLLERVEQEVRLRLWRALAREKKILDPASSIHRIAVTATTYRFRIRHP